MVVKSENWTITNNIISGNTILLTEHYPMLQPTITDQDWNLFLNTLKSDWNNWYNPTTEQILTIHNRQPATLNQWQTDTQQDLNSIFGLPNTIPDSTGPVVISFAINNGASSTSSRNVTLNNTCTGSPTHYMASESSSFSGASWQSYSAALSFTLSLGNGTKTVYFKVKNPSGQESAAVSDSITLSESSILTLTVNGSTVSGNISPAGDVDWYQFTATSAGTYRIETWAGTLTDNYMYLYGPNSQTTLIEEDDDDGGGNAAMIQRSLSVGTYYVKIRAYSSSGTGTYTIRVTR